ncbi:hypothetical protein FOQG_18642 [Fusarium oxysporum f. sp. raphani 54005]|uniref:Uncharacterized protein n=1 Tax=Fusarium oxysporum f. sp. raphani 54005 TaxID=1089458 RepID=X0C1F1_FUSOX|nr:hypothetical protein FOQG_18642 [Fusarium oxysporum f. sp. raphani 54005]
MSVLEYADTQHDKKNIDQSLYLVSLPVTVAHPSFLFSPWQISSFPRQSFIWHPRLYLDLRKEIPALCEHVERHAWRSLPTCFPADIDSGIIAFGYRSPVAAKPVNVLAKAIYKIVDSKAEFDCHLLEDTVCQVVTSLLMLDN